MKKIFEAPVVNTVQLDSDRDVIMASTLATQKANVGSLKDENKVTDIWMGAGEGWL